MKKVRYLSVAAFISCLALSACGNKPAPIPDNFFNVTTFDEELDAHSEDMINFMNYDGDYTTLTESQFKQLFHTDPELSQSEGKTWEISFEHDAEEAEEYYVEVALDNNFENPYVFEAHEGKATIQNLFVGQTHYYRIKAVTGNDVEYSKAYTLETANTLPRLINIDGMTNCRDLGGKVTEDGKGVIRQGLIYRTAALDDPMSGSIITDVGRKTMLEQLGVRTEIELRGGPKGEGGEQDAKERPSLLNDESVTCHFNPMGYEGGKSPLYRNIIPVVRFFEHFSEENFYPAFFHCRIGTDRTGFCATLLNGLLGISLEDCYRDYMFSNFGKIQKTSTIHQTGQDSPDKYLQDLQDFEGDTFQQKVYNFLRTIGVRASTLQSILETLVDGEIPDLEANSIAVATPENFGLESGSKIDTSTQFRSPAKVVNVSSNGKTTLSVDVEDEFEGSLYLNVAAYNTDKTVNTAFKVDVDGDAVTLANTSLSTTVSGFNTSTTFYVPLKLTEELYLGAGEHVITIENTVSKNFNIFTASFIGAGAGGISFIN